MDSKKMTGMLMNAAEKNDLKPEFLGDETSGLIKSAQAHLSKNMSNNHGPQKPAPQLLIRWLTSAQMRTHMAQDQVRPSWRHFLPALVKFKSGICFDMMTTSHWRAPYKRIGIVIDSSGLPESVKTHAIEGHKVYSLSEAMRWEFDPVKRQERTNDAKKNAESYSSDPDELFVLGTIDGLGSRLKGIIVIDPTKQLGPKLTVELDAFSRLNQVPVIPLTGEEFGHLRSNQTAMRQCLDSKSVTMALATYPSRKMKAKP